MSSKETVLITGCSDGGIGSELAIVLQQSGSHVFATARDPSKMSNLSGLSNVTLLTLDVVKSADIKAAAEAVSKETSRTLNYLTNNAGRSHFMHILDEDLDTVRNFFEINFLGPVALTQAFAPLLIKAKGMAVYVTSISGYLNIPYMGTYSASKRSLEIVAETLRLELAPFGVDVLELPQQSLHKSVEDIVAVRAQGNEGMPRMETREYAAAVVDAIKKRTTGRFWCGNNADQIKMSTTATRCWGSNKHWA
ncbi:putative hydroxybutyrate dehydrogenase [Daldinia caldariorum]|uniref:putative hydroxybutyrate dehydrogenase n=1 Tax=Daldinia caldariorum TaxID=326644 RepID=UPI002008E2F4|nr:putative hydroxybutyrate dehydrogenase [Daldinia caldariorum]KAI1471053.1 putative hydroxybutyrate dehydrogenase [Daldinia caldariorum]